MPFDMDGNWQGEESPMCPDCLDVAMQETEKGYECPACYAGIIWDEHNGIWRNYPSPAKFWDTVRKVWPHDG